nr:TetR family transcriptional regulator C-terminal domain-containing protein [Petrachloros mirabilis]
MQSERLQNAHSAGWAMLLTFLPLDPERQTLLRVWVAFLGYAIGRPELMAEHQRSAAELRSQLIAELEALQQEQQVRADIDPRVEANALLALVNGLGLDFLIQSQALSPVQQTQVVQRYVEGLK